MQQAYPDIAANGDGSTPNSFPIVGSLLTNLPAGRVTSIVGKPLPGATRTLAANTATASQAMVDQASQSGAYAAGAVAPPFFNVSAFSGLYTEESERESKSRPLRRVKADPADPLCVLMGDVGFPIPDGLPFQTDSDASYALLLKDEYRGPGAVQRTPDSSSYNRITEVVNPTDATQVGDGIQFIGTSYMVSEHVNLSLTGQFTVRCRVKSTGVNETYVGMWSDNFGASNVVIGSDGSGNYFASAVDNGGNPAFLFASAGDANPHYLELTWDGTTLRFFKDGTLNDSAALGSVREPSPTPITIAGNYPNPTTLGAGPGATTLMHGVMYQVEVADICRHVSNFTATPFVSDSRSLLLLNCDLMTDPPSQVKTLWQGVYYEFYNFRLATQPDIDLGYTYTCQSITRVVQANSYNGRMFALGGNYSNDSNGPDVYAYANQGTGINQRSFWGAMAVGANPPITDLFIHPNDLRRGWCNHPVSILVSNYGNGTPSWPGIAARTDGTIPAYPFNGCAWFDVDPREPVPSNLSNLEKVFFRTLQIYGGIVCDKTLFCIAVRVSQECQPLLKVNSPLGGDWSIGFTGNFPWNKLRLLQPGSDANYHPFT